MPWAVPLTAVYLWFFWRYLNGSGPPGSTAEERRTSLRAIPACPPACGRGALRPRGIVEEAAFRGYMQGPIERRHGLAIAILITGTMFALAHLDFTLILWPYDVAVAAIYGIVTHLTRSILPAVVLHTCGNIYSNFDLWLHGQAEWQAQASATQLIWKSGADASFWISSTAFLIVTAAMVWAYRRLGRAAITGQPSADY